MDLVKKIFEQAFGVEIIKTLPEDSINYVYSICEEHIQNPSKIDKDSQDELFETIFPLLVESQEAFKMSEEELENKIKNDIIVQFKPSNKKTEDKKVLNAPIKLIKEFQTQEEQIKHVLERELPKDELINDTIERLIDSTNLDSLDNLQSSARSEKKVLRQEKKDTRKEIQQAAQREEILKKLKNKPVKLHTFGEHDNKREKDIKLENVTMALSALELLVNTEITLISGQKYGLIGRNGIGKTTFLKFLASKLFPGIPKHLQILHIEQEVFPSDESVLECILGTDIERTSLLKEQTDIQNFLDALQEKKENEGKKVENNKEEKEKVENNKEEKKVEKNGLTLFEKITQKYFLKPDPLVLVPRLSQIFDRLQEIDSDRAIPLAASILSGLGFTNETMKNPTKTFSGGWRMRISLAQALFIQPDILLLDEPTNHLDLHSVLWLEEYLKTWKKTLVVVSHDRDFLDTIATDIIWMKDRKLFKYKGNYSSYVKQRDTEMKVQSKNLENYERQKDKLQNYIDKNRVAAATAKMAQSRIKILAKLEIPETLSKDPHFTFVIPEPDPLQQPIIQMTDISFGYSKDKILYEGVSLQVDMESRAALVGDNGVGKSTLLKLIMNEIEPITGQIKIHRKAKISRFTQHHMDQLDLEKTPLGWFQFLYPNAKPQDLRKHLGSMGITGKLQLQPIYSLSGGQKSRVAFAHVTYLKPQLLLLDEPTNHLDMETIDALIMALNSYEGGVLIVSHDAYLISAVCNEIWVCKDQKITPFPGDFDDYKNHLQSTIFKKH